MRGKGTGGYGDFSYAAAYSSYGGSSSGCDPHNPSTCW